MCEIISFAFKLAVFTAVFCASLVTFIFIGMAIAFGISNFIEWIREKGWKRDENA